LASKLNPGSAAIVTPHCLAFLVIDPSCNKCLEHCIGHHLNQLLAAFKQSPDTPILLPPSLTRCFQLLLCAGPACVKAACS
jgi:hypothetical protein